MPASVASQRVPTTFSVQWNDRALPAMARDRSADGSVLVTGMQRHDGSVPSLLVQRAWRLPAGRSAPDVGGFAQVQPQTGEAIRVESQFDTRPTLTPGLAPTAAALAGAVMRMAGSTRTSAPMTDAEYAFGIATRPDEYAVSVDDGSGWQVWRGRVDDPATAARDVLAAARSALANPEVARRMAALDGDAS